MDIDITDSAFSLDVPNINQLVNSSTDGATSDYTMYIYIGAAILVIFISMLIYKFYQNKQREQNSEDCSGGFCTMNASSSQI